MVKPTNKSELIQVYFGESHEDPHLVYSSRVGISRTDAKLEVYHYLYSHPFLKGVIWAAREEGRSKLSKKPKVQLVKRYHKL